MGLLILRCCFKCRHYRFCFGSHTRIGDIAEKIKLSCRAIPQTSYIRLTNTGSEVSPYVASGNSIFFGFTLVSFLKREE